VQPVIRELQRRKADIIIGLSHAGEETQHGLTGAVAVYVHVETAVAAATECRNNRIVLSTHAELQQLFVLCAVWQSSPGICLCA
jgi:2',3'-cyclic-nucleotide 2'-phosphodiesterase (5'-nucleotidase family)